MVLKMAALFRSSLRPLVIGRRSQSLLSVSVNSESIAHVELCRPPVNALSIEFLGDIESTFIDLSKDTSVKGIILSSFSEKIFSSGLDLNELVQKEKIDNMGAAFRDVSSTLYGSVSKPFAVAIAGHAPAGGTLLSMCADYRVATPRATLGLNESVIGIVVPEWMALMYEALLGPRQAELGLMLGTLYPAEKALALGLIDEVVENKEVALARCEEIVKRLIQGPEPEARYLTKRIARKRVIESFIADPKGQALASFFKKPEVQANIQRYINSLKKPKK